MTIIVVILIGAGTILIASSLDCTSIVATFQKIIGGQPIDWSGSGVNCTQPTPLSSQGGVFAPTNFPGASGPSPTGKPCTLAPNASQTAVEIYCACIAGYGSPPLAPDGSSAYQAYRSCLVAQSKGTTS